MVFVGLLGRTVWCSGVSKAEIRFESQGLKEQKNRNAIHV